MLWGFWVFFKTSVFKSPSICGSVPQIASSSSRYWFFQGGSVPGLSSTFTGWADFTRPISVLCRDHKYSGTCCSISSLLVAVSIVALQIDSCHQDSLWLSLTLSRDHNLDEVLILTLPDGKVPFYWYKNSFFCFCYDFSYVLLVIFIRHHQSHMWHTLLNVVLFIEIIIMYVLIAAPCSPGYFKTNRRLWQLLKMSDSPRPGNI